MSGHKSLRKGFGVYFDPSKSTSGQRFFGDLYQALAKDALSLDQRPEVILFNVSAPLKTIIRAKLRSQKIILRIDGLYFDRLSPAFLLSFNLPLQKLFSLGLRFPRLHNVFAFVANLLNRNYGTFLRIVLADKLIYQSNFCRKIYSRYFPEKQYEIIVNGSVYKGNVDTMCVSVANNEIRLVTIYDEWRHAKRVHDLVKFLKWTHETQKVLIKLTILGYNGRIPTCASPDVKNLIETAPYITTLPKFKSFDGKIKHALINSDIYITFTFRDSCPNAVVEAMAHGLPVVGVASGGMQDIVGDAGILIPMDDFADGFFSSHRYECDFPPIDSEQILDAILKVSSMRTIFQARARRRFSTDLDINVVAKRYALAMRSLVDYQFDKVGL